MNKLDKLATQYKSINEQIKTLESKKDELKASLMTLDGEQGDLWKISVTEYKSDRVESLKAIKDKSPSLFKALHDAGSIKSITSTRLNIKSLT